MPEQEDIARVEASADAPVVYKQNCRVRDVIAARSIYDTLWNDDRERRHKRGRLRNQLEGGRPWDPKVLKSIGRTDATNHNFRDAEASAERAESPYWEMAHNVPNKASFTIQKNYPQKEQDESSMADAFDLMLDDWGMDYILKFKKLSQEYIRFGPAFLTWENPHTARWKPLKGNNVHFPKDTPIEPGQWEIVMVDDEVGISDLWSHVKPGEESASRMAGWNIEMVKRVIAKVGTGVLGEGVRNRRLDDWDYVQDEIKDNDITVTNTWPNVPLVHQFVREEDGKISHKIFIRDGISSLGKNDRGTEASNDPSKDSHAAQMGRPDEDTEEVDPEPEAPEDFVFEQIAAAEQFEQLIAGLFSEVGNGNVHGVNGFAQKNYSHGVLINRVKCRLVDSLNFSTSMNFQRPAEYADDNPPLESFGSVNVFAPGIQQLEYAPRLNESLSVLNMLQNNMSENNALFREQTNQIAETESATAASILGQLQAQTSQANAALFLAQLGNIYKEMIRRLRIRKSEDPDAKKFVQRCKDRNVPEDVIYDAEITISSAATAATSSPVQRDMLWTQIRQDVRSTPGGNVRWVDQQYYAAKLGADAAKKIMPSNPEMTDAAIISEALIENNVLGTGQMLPVDMMQDHVIHVTEHLKPMQNIAEAGQQGLPIKPDHLVAVQMLGQHVEQHLQMLAQDEVRKEEFKVLNKQYNVINQALQQLINTAISQQQAAQNAPQPQ